MRKAVGQAPARVNLLGGHTDYNQGFVLPTVLPYTTVVRAEKQSGVTAHSENFTEERTARLGEKSGDWPDYLAAVVWVLKKAGYEVPGARFWVSSTIPMGVGLSSSAALTVAALKALRGLYDLDLDDLTLALLAQRAESEYVGVRCGVMDQLTVALGHEGEALFIDTRSLEYRRLPLIDGVEVIVVDSATPRRLATSGYNQRRAECQVAARMLGVVSLRDVNELERVEKLPEPYRRRARHVVAENQRVLTARTALERGDAAEFGRLMLASHRSLRDDFEVSTPELDRLVELSWGAGAFGARVTGAGFGGAIVALVPSAAAVTFKEKIREGYPAARFY
ncbi:galactokinase [Oceanithermus desulfurans]